MAHRLSESDVSPAIAKKIAARASRADEAVIVGTRAGVIEWANAAWSKVTGFKVDDAVDKPIGWLLDAAEIDADVVDFVQRHFMTGLRCEVELPVITPDGRSLWIHLDVEPFRDAQGEVADFVAVATDITARREGELALEDRIARALAESDDDSDLHLGAVASPGDAASADELDLEALEARLALARIAEAAQQSMGTGDATQALALAGEIARTQLDACARPSSPRAIDVAEALEPLCLPILRDLPARVALDAEIDASLPAAYADRDGLDTLMRDLLQSATQAMGDEWGTLSLTAGFAEPGQALLSPVHPSFDRHPLTTPRAHVFVEVHDTAISLSRESIRFIQERTGDAPSDTRALSLALAAARAQALGATLRIHSMPGTGTRAVLYLPII